MTFSEVRRSSGMNKSQFANFLNIPLRTIQNWESGDRECKDWLLDLIKYKVDNEIAKGNLSIEK